MQKFLPWDEKGKEVMKWPEVTLRLSDSVIPVALLLLIEPAYAIYPETKAFFVSSIIISLVALIFMHENGVYERLFFSDISKEIATLASAWVQIVGMLFLIAYLCEEIDKFTYTNIFAWLVLTPAVLLCYHIFCKKILSEIYRHTNRKLKTVVVGSGPDSLKIAKVLQRTDRIGLHFAGFFDNDCAREGADNGRTSHPGSLKDLEARLYTNEIDQVYVPFHLISDFRYADFIYAIRHSNSSLCIVPVSSGFSSTVVDLKVKYIAGMPVVALIESPFCGPSTAIKALEDVIVSLILLVITAPILIFAWLAILLSQGRPVLFRQRRYGVNGKEISVWKFRTMNVCEDGDKIEQTVRIDPRVTPVGAFLRRFSMDELPQLFNVLIGDMSIVGPRPHAVAHNEYYRNLIDGYMWRHKVKPGITGLAQVRGCRGGTESVDAMKRRVELDLEYIREWSLWMDIKIMLITIWAVIRGENAY